MTRKGGAAPRKRTALPDLVYPYRSTGDDEALRYSLRSVAANARGLFGRVWIVGDLPEWATDVGHIVTTPGASRQEDIRAKWTAAAGHPDVAATFLLMNDDFWLVRKVRRFEAFHMGPLDRYLAHLDRSGDAFRAWRRVVETTAEWMAEQGYPDTMVRQGHRPAMFDKARLADALAAYPAGRPLDVLGLYDMCGAGGVGTRAGNAKINTTEHFHAKTAPAVLDVQPWLSANDAAFSDGLIGGYVRALFPDPSPFEQAP